MTKTGIKALRSNLGETRKQFGERFGRAARTVEQWEQGYRVPDRLVQRLMQELATGLEKVKKKRQ